VSDDPVDVVQRPATDQCQRTIQCGVQAVQQADQLRRGGDQRGIVAEIQQGTVDIKQQRPARACTGQWRGRQRSFRSGVGAGHRPGPVKANVKDACWGGAVLE